MTHSLKWNDYDDIPSDPNTPLGFEIDPQTGQWSFTPEFYPDDFTQMKKKELKRYNNGCSGESVSIKAVKNREFHATGVMLHGEIPDFQRLIETEARVDLLSPLTPSGGMECVVKSGELGNQDGWDPQTRQRLFEYTLDLVSTGRDERDTDNNSIVTAIMATDVESPTETTNDNSASLTG